MTYNKEIQDRLKTNEIKVNPYRLYVGKWDGIWDQDEFCKIREKISHLVAGLLRHAHAREGDGANSH